MKHMTRNLTLAAAMTLAMATLGTGMAYAADAAPEAKPDNEISFNAALTSDYRYRGISQSRLKPALQGGADWVNNPTGFYVGTWASTIKWIDDAGGDVNFEWDIYAGKRGELSKDVSYDVGFLAYVYPSSKLTPTPTTREIYAQLGFGAYTLKYSHSISNLFGFADSKNSGYLDASANLELDDGYVLNVHLGHQTIRHNHDYSYTDWKIGVSKDFGVAAVSLAYVDTNTKAYVGRNKDLGKAGLVLAVSKTF